MIPFQTNDYDLNPGFVERVNQIVFPDLQPENLVLPHRNYIINGLILAQTHIVCLRESNVSFFQKSESQDNCNVSIIHDAPRGRIHGVFAFKPCFGCTRQRYEQKPTAFIMRYVDKWAVCGCTTENDICNARRDGDEVCASQTEEEDDTEFLCAEKNFAYGVKHKLYLAPRFPCGYIVGVHWEGIKREYNNVDLVTDDNDVIDLIAHYLEGEKYLRIDRDMDRWSAIMRKPNLDRRDPGGTFYQKLADVAHRCREERRIRKTVWNEDLFDDSALSHFNVSALDPLPVLPDEDCTFSGYDDGYTYGVYEGYECDSPIVSLVANDESITAGETVVLSWSSIVQDLDSSVITIEYGGTVIVVPRNEDGSILFNPTENTTYTIRAVTACGTVEQSITVAVAPAPPCLCPEGLPDCLQYDVPTPSDVFIGCGALATFDGNGNPLWDGTLPLISPCRWGYEFEDSVSFTSITAGTVYASIILELVSCNPYLYRLTFTFVNDGVPTVVWQGESIGTPFGPFNTRVSLCPPSADFAFIACEPCTAPIVRFDPPSGSIVNFPTLVFLHADIAGGEIYYGIDEDPVNLYTGPISLSAGQVLKARAIGPAPAFCVGDIYTATYQLDTGLEFDFICDGPQDKVGVFGIFSPNGVLNDYHWRIKATRGTPWTLRSAKVYESDETGVWVTGQAWATLNPIYPIELGGAPFSVYPMVFFSGASQLNNAYGEPVSSFPAGQTTLHAYGQPFVPLIGYFRLEFTIDEGGAPFTIYKLIPHVCAPTPCPVAPEIFLSANCQGVINVSATLQTGLSYRIYRATMPSCGNGVHSFTTSFVATTEDFQRTELGNNNCTYSYFISVFCAATGAWIDGTPKLVTVPPPCVQPTEFCNSTRMGIPTIGPASVYPSPITVSGRPGTVQKAIVKVFGYWHGFPDDVEILIVGPDGTKVLLMNDVGGGGADAIPQPGVNLVFDDAGAIMPNDGTIVPPYYLPSGTYRPTSYGVTFFSSPAPAGPYATTLAAFIGKPCNGVWNLFVLDDNGINLGAIEGGWCLELPLS